MNLSLFCSQPDLRGLPEDVPVQFSPVVRRYIILHLVQSFEQPPEETLR